MPRLALFAGCAIAAAVALTGCASGTVNHVMSDPACVVKGSGEVNFGSITPTGKAKINFTCKPGVVAGPDAVKPADVAAPPAP